MARSALETEAILGYAAAVRSALTDDGRPPLEASGLKLYSRLSAIAASLDEVAEKEAPSRAETDAGVAAKGLEATAALWPELEQAYRLPYEAAHLLENVEGLSGAQVAACYDVLLEKMRERAGTVGPLQKAWLHFLKVTESY